jgi:hypothetical protein
MAACLALILALAVSWWLSCQFVMRARVWNGRLWASGQVAAQSGRVFFTVHGFGRWNRPSDSKFHGEFSIDRPDHWSTEHQFLLVGWDRRIEKGRTEAERRLVVPHAYLMVLAAVFPAIVWTRSAVHRRRVRAGRCGRCGYDMRATPARCPECGRAASPAKSPGRLRARWSRMRPARRWLLGAAAAGAFALAAWGLWYRYVDPLVSFTARATLENRGWVWFHQPPNAASLRYVARLPGAVKLTFWFSGDAPPAEDPVFRGVRLPNVTRLSLVVSNADLVIEDLTRDQAPLENLTGLNDTGSLSDKSLRQLTRPGMPLRKLEMLEFWGTHVTPEGIELLSKPDSGLRALRQLKLVNFQGKGGACVSALTRPDSGLKGLRALSIINTELSDAALLAHLAAPTTGLAGMEELELWSTDVTDAGLKALARPDGGLRRLESLTLDREKSIGASTTWGLGRGDSGLVSLRKLSIQYGNADDRMLAQLARPGSGFGALTHLKLIGQNVTDRGLQELTRQETALPALTDLKLIDTKATPAGVAALQKARPGLKIFFGWYDPDW